MRSSKLSAEGRHVADKYLAEVINQDSASALGWERFGADVAPPLRLAHAELRSLYGVGARDPNELKKATRVLEGLDPETIPKHLRHRPLIVLSQTLSALSRLEPKQQPQEAAWVNLRRRLQGSLDETPSHKPAHAAIQEALSVVNSHCAFAAAAYIAKLQNLLELFIKLLVSCKNSYKASEAYWLKHVGEPLEEKALAFGLIPQGEAPLTRAGRFKALVSKAFVDSERRGFSYELSNGLSFEVDWRDNGEDLWVSVIGIAQPKHFLSQDPGLMRYKTGVSFRVLENRKPKSDSYDYLFTAGCFVAAPARDAHAEMLEEETFELRWPDNGKPNVVLNGLKTDLPVSGEYLADDNIELSLKWSGEGVELALELMYSAPHRPIVEITSGAGSVSVALEDLGEKRYQGVIPLAEGQEVTVAVKVARATDLNPPA